MKYKKIAQELNTNSLIVASFLKGNERTALTSEQLLQLLELYQEETKRIKSLVIAKLEQRKEVGHLLKVNQKDAYNKGYQEGAQDAADDTLSSL